MAGLLFHDLHLYMNETRHLYPCPKPKTHIQNRRPCISNSPRSHPFFFSLVDLFETQARDEGRCLASTPIKKTASKTTSISKRYIEIEQKSFTEPCAASCAYMKCKLSQDNEEERRRHLLSDRPELSSPINASTTPAYTVVSPVMSGRCSSR